MPAPLPRTLPPYIRKMATYGSHLALGMKSQSLVGGSEYAKAWSGWKLYVAPFYPLLMEKLHSSAINLNIDVYSVFPSTCHVLHTERYGTYTRRSSQASIRRSGSPVARGLEKTRTVWVFQPSDDLLVIHAARGIRMQPTYIHDSQSCLVRLENTLRCLT
jgi:hypothetical protein